MEQQDPWFAGGKEIEAPFEPYEKECEGRNCLNSFLVTFHTQRRCPRCRQEKRAYKEADAPF